MLSPGGAAAGVLYSESVLSLYPQLVKRITAPLSSQVAVRCIVYSVLALVFGGIGSLAQVFGGGFLNLAIFLILGAINLLHVWTSYYAFQKLPSGVSLTMFYTYPIMNVIGAWLFFGEEIGLKAIPFFLLALLGVWMVGTAKGSMAKGLVVHENGKERGDEVEGMKDHGEFDFLGILAGLGAAATETAIYLILYWLKAEKGGSMFTSIHRVYTSAALMLLPFLGGMVKIPDMKELKIMGLWNALLGFTGYAARFAAIPAVSPVIYSALSMFGIFASYMWGWLFGGETITTKGLVGSGLVGASIFLMRQYGGFTAEV
jgi:drug/metabolite transporter (DMT)-like permease